MRTITFWFLFVLLLVGTLAFSYRKYQGEVAAPAPAAVVGCLHFLRSA